MSLLGMSLSALEVPLGTLGIQAATGNADRQRQFYTEQVRTPPQLKLCLGKNQRKTMKNHDKTMIKL